MTFLDTHVVAFLYGGKLNKLSAKAKRQIEFDELRISPVVLLELEMLREKGEFNARSEDVLASLMQSVGLSVCQLPMAHVVRSAIPLGWTRDPMDRLIVANAIAYSHAPLVSKDERIGQYYPHTIW